MILQNEPVEHALDRALDIQLSCAFQKPLITACSNQSGLIAVYGVDSEARACILIVSLASPSSQVWVRVPRALESSPMDSLEWSPVGVEEMLLFKCTDRVGVLSMSSPERGEANSVNWRFFNSWHFHEVCTAAPGVPIACAQWLQPPPSLRWPDVLDQHRYAYASPSLEPTSSRAPFSPLAPTAESFSAEEHLTLTTQDAGAAESGQLPPRQEWVRPHKPLIAVLSAEAKLTLYQYSPFRIRTSCSGEAAQATSPWQPSTAQDCALLREGASIQHGTVSAAWGGRLQIILAIHGWQESPTALAVPHPDAPTPVHIQCTGLVGSPFCPPQSGFGCDPGAEPIDFRLSGGAQPVGIFCMPDRLHRWVLLLLQLPCSSGGGWIVRCVQRSDVAAICTLESKHIQLPKRPQPLHIAPVEAGPEPRREAAQGTLSPDGTMLAVLGSLRAGQQPAVVVLDVRDLQAHGGRIKVRLVSRLPWLPERSMVAHLQWTPSSAGLLALVSDIVATGAAGVFHRSCRIELLMLGDSAAYNIANSDGSHSRSAALPGSDAAPRVQLSADAVKRYAAACPFVSKLPALPDVYSAIAEGVYLGYRAAHALQLGLTYVDVEHLLAWRCVRLRHGVMTHIAVIVVSSVLKAAMPDFMMRQAKLIAFKLAIAPLLFHVTSVEEKVEVEVLVAELRIKQRLALALDHLSQWSLCWRPLHGMDAASLHISEQMLAALKRRHDFAKPWLTWSVGLMYYMLLEMRQYEAAEPPDAARLLEHSAGVRCGRDPYFAKLMEKLVRLQTALRAPMATAGPLVAPASVQRACGTLEGRLVAVVCHFWRVFLSRTLQLARSPHDRSDIGSAASCCFGMSFDHHVFVPTWCDWVRYVYREQDSRNQQGAVLGMDKISPSVHREVASNLRKMAAAIKTPVATMEEMSKNREYLCLKAPMHTAVALLHCDAPSPAHSISPAGMQSLILGAKRASSRPMFVHAFRHEELREAGGANGHLARKRARYGPDAVSGLLPHQRTKDVQALGGGPGASASSDVLGARGLMLVEALDGSCGTHELPPYDEMRSSKSARSAEPTAQQLFWAPQPLRQLLRSCTGGAPLGGQPWKRLPAQIEPAGQPPTSTAAASAPPAAGGAAAGAGAAAAQQAAVSVVASPGVMSPAGPMLASPAGVILSGDGGDSAAHGGPAGGMAHMASSSHGNRLQHRAAGWHAGVREEEPTMDTPDMGI
eukprot:jgi/Ulvmu1/4037/UM019_0014.1